jgi:hypothetical protein
MVDTTPALAPPLRLLLALPAGVLATLAMDLVAARVPEGETPPFVASGVLTGRHPDVAPGRLAAVVHYVAGLLTGPLFVTLLLLVEALLGASTLAYGLTAAMMLVLMVGFFVGVVLPRPTFPGTRRTQVARAWTAQAVVYLVVMTPLAWAGSAAVAAL